MSIKDSYRRRSFIIIFFLISNDNYKSNITAAAETIKNTQYSVAVLLDVISQQQYFKHKVNT